MTHSGADLLLVGLLTLQCTWQVGQLQTSIEGALTRLCASVQVVGSLTLQFTTDLQ